MIFGGIFLFVVFGSRTDQKINMETTRLLFGIFAIVSSIGVVTLGLLPQKREIDHQSTSHFKELGKKLFGVYLFKFSEDSKTVRHKRSMVTGCCIGFYWH